MTRLLLSHRCASVHGAEVAAAAAGGKFTLDIVPLPADRDQRLPAADCRRLDIAFFSEDVFPDFSRQFFSSVRKAPNLKWLHVFNAGVDHPIYAEMLARGVRLTTSSGSNAEPIAQTAIASLLLLARNFPRWLAAQRQHRWDPMRTPDVPHDLKGQTALILGLGNIGNEIARLARALGLRVIGVRRGGKKPGDYADELHPVTALDELLSRAEWLVVSCPLTAETRGLIDARALAKLPAGARVINVSRGEIVDEAALIQALKRRQLVGAYLDVFEKEPLPPDSPLWDMPNVIVTPHNSAAAAGNEARVNKIFLDNLGRWSRGEKLVNEVSRA